MIDSNKTYKAWVIKNASVFVILFGPYRDAVASACRNPHGESDWGNTPAAVQERETETFSVVSGCNAGEARETPHRETTCRRTTDSLFFLSNQTIRLIGKQWLHNF